MPAPRRHPATAWLLSLALACLAGCQAAEAPATWEWMELRGTPHERGVQHGERFSSKLRSLYTQLLATSILPYLNRERNTISEVLWTYQEPQYDDGRFSTQLFLESAQSLAETMPAEYLEEMRGIADGAGVSLDQVLILNTFMDTLVAFRAMTFFLRDAASPQLTWIDYEGAGEDGADNDGDGLTDEPGEARMPFEPSAWVAMVEVPPGARIRLCLEDPDGVDPTLVRLQTQAGAYRPGEPGVQLGTCGEGGEGLEVAFQPPGGFPPAAYVSVIVSAGDMVRIEEPPPVKANMAREQRFGFTTRGYGALPWQVPERSFDDGRSQPGPFGFAARGPATADGQPILAHHFSMLDSNTAHKHAALLVHHPEQGFAHATLGWTGSVFGFSGMNTEGLSFAANPCDSLENPLVAALRRDLFLAKLRSRGIPMGLLGREVLTRARRVSEALVILEAAELTFGWCVLLADAEGDIALVEMDTDILGDGQSFHVTRPGELDALGRPLASAGEHDLRLHVHWLKNADDLDIRLLGFALRPQRYWTSYFFRSVRSHHLLGEALGERLGGLDRRAAEELLSTPELVDSRDSMNATIAEPARRLLRFALGQVPASAGGFHTLDLSREPFEVRP
jgi:hypothetical protein